jgi:hypothetical protein
MLSEMRVSVLLLTFLQHCGKVVSCVLTVTAAAAAAAASYGSDRFV